METMGSPCVRWWSPTSTPGSPPWRGPPAPREHGRRHEIACRRPQHPMAAPRGRARPPGAGRGSTGIRDRPRTARGPRSAPIEVRRAAVGSRCPVEGGAIPQHVPTVPMAPGMGAPPGPAARGGHGPIRPGPTPLPWRTGLVHPTTWCGSRRLPCSNGWDGRSSARLRWI